MNLLLILHQQMSKKCCFAKAQIKNCTSLKITQLQGQNLCMLTILEANAIFDAYNQIN